MTWEASLPQDLSERLLETPRRAGRKDTPSCVAASSLQGEAEGWHGASPSAGPALSPRPVAAGVAPERLCSFLGLGFLVLSGGFCQTLWEMFSAL